MPRPARAKMDDYRRRLREQGLRPIQIWVPDVRAATFAEEARRQSRLVSRARRAKSEGLDFIESAFDWDDDA